MVKLKTLIVKSLGICCTIAVMSFTGCAPTDTITLTEADIVNMTYEQDSSALDNVEMEEYSISLPERVCGCILYLWLDGILYSELWRLSDESWAGRG